MTIYTIGHSTRELADFLRVLKHYRIKTLADVRTVPQSRHVPHFAGDALAHSVGKEGIAYRHFPALGGLRKAKKDSSSTAWLVPGFRGYADHMHTHEFERAIEELAKTARDSVTVMMCAEAIPWRCHRSMIGDALLVRGFHVVDIFDENKAQDEKLTEFAVVDGLEISYPKSE